MIVGDHVGHVMLHKTSTILRLESHPSVQKIGNGAIEIFLAQKFLMPKACIEIIVYSQANNVPSSVADFNGDHAFRTSTTSYLDADLHVVRFIRETIAYLVDIDLSHGEPLQAQRYLPGQEFKLHCDWFRPGSTDYEKFCVKSGGQRTWTAMAYLNDVEQGGETVFPHADLVITPKAGDLVIWNNLKPNGEGEPKTGHHAKPVLVGEKHVITQWFREGPWR